MADRNIQRNLDVCSEGKATASSQMREIFRLKFDFSFGVLSDAAAKPAACHGEIANYVLLSYVNSVQMYV